MVATAELQAAIREALRHDRSQTDQAIWHDYFFGSDENADLASGSPCREHGTPSAPPTRVARQG